MNTKDNKNRASITNPWKDLYKPYDELSLFGREYTRLDPVGVGGSFQNALFKAYYAADPDNRKRLVSAFPRYFNELDLDFDYYAS